MSKRTLREEFFIESFENLTVIEKKLHELKQLPKNDELVREIFRQIHILKGSASFLGLSKLQELTHSFENLLDELKTKRPEGYYEIIECLFTTLAHCKQMVESIKLGEIENSQKEGEGIHKTDSLEGTLKGLAVEIGKAQGKKISLDFYCEEKSFSDELRRDTTNLLIQLVKNSCDHGIEIIEVRKDKKKSIEGTIQVRVCNSLDVFSIEVVDDGGGLDRGEVENKVLQLEILDRKISQKLSDEEIFQYIFHPGLSTSKSITSISGRGVGLDIVKHKVEELGGRILLNSNYGKGLSIRIEIIKKT